jgi:MFS transporter, DHA2 family, multidrug resistance protein
MAGTGQLAPSTKKIAVGFLALSNFIVVLDMTVANVSIPHIAGDIGVSLDQGTWIITSYSVAEALTVPLTGWLAMRFGAVRMYALCMTGFGLFSLLCAMSLTLPLIIASRIGQGLTGGLIMALSQTLMLHIFSVEERGKAMLLTSMTVLMGPALGPNIGGFISDNFSWHWIFLINLPIVAGCVTSAIVLLRPAETPINKVPIDGVGLALMFTWIGALQLMLDLGREKDWFGDPLIVALAVIAGIGFVVFVIWELTDEHPVVDLRVFRHPGFSFGVIVFSLCFGAYFASIVVIPQWLQSTMGYPAQAAGIIVAGTAIGALLTGQLAVKAVGKGIDSRILVSGAVIWIGLMALVRSEWTSGMEFWQIAAPQYIQGMGMAFLMMPLSMMTINSVLPEEMATATGLQNFVRTLSIGIFTAIALTIWGDSQQEAKSEMVAKLRPDETMRTLGEAGMSAQQSSGFINAILDREAVTMAMDHVFLVTAAIFMVSALVVWLVPKPKRPTMPMQAPVQKQTSE